MMEADLAVQGWRREHAARVFQAIQAVMAVIATYELIEEFWATSGKASGKLYAAYKVSGWTP